MKAAAFSLVFTIALVVTAHADLTIVQRTEGAGPTADMTLKVKGDMSRLEVTPELSMIFNGKTGETIQLMKDQKTVVRISAEKMKAAAEMVSKFNGQPSPGATAKLSPTGKKETINGYATEEYISETGMSKASYWIAPKFPDGAAILKQLRAMKSGILDSSNSGVPDYTELPGVPIRTVLTMGGNRYTTTILSVKQEPLSDTEFVVPKDFQEVKAPEISQSPSIDNRSTPSVSPAP
jgi:hypothetical protein